MKIEKVNEHQIRCTLTKNDLADRELKISELAYGTEKAKSLFRDMMQQASFEFGFEAEDIPLMIEAIPLNSECIVLIITKVEDPEELDTRFSKFAPSVHDTGNPDDDASEASSSGADDVLDLFKKIQENAYSDSGDEVSDADTPKLESFQQKLERAKEKIKTNAGIDMVKIYSFDSINSITRLAHVLNQFYTGVNSLYKDPRAGRYLLVLSKSSHCPEDYNKICNIISEYGTALRFAATSDAYLEEHFEPLLKDSALQSLVNV